jgi:hypothetical protein
MLDTVSKSLTLKVSQRLPFIIKRGETLDKQLKEDLVIKM